jgi:hypothetical protein
MGRIKKKGKKTIYNIHHVIYGDDKNKEVTRRIRKGCHQIITLIRRYSFLTDQEINTIKLESELKRRYDNEEK